MYGPNRISRYKEEVARIHKKLYKKDLYDPDNHDGVVIHLEPDILECEVKWALGSIITNSLISVKLFQVLKDDAIKVSYSI